MKIGNLNSFIFQISPLQKVLKTRARISALRWVLNNNFSNNYEAIQKKIKECRKVQHV